MDDLLSEKEQIEAIRSWWGENGRFVVSGIVIGVGLLVGWNYWNDRQREAQFGASAVYESLLGEVADADVSAAEEIANQLYEDYEATIYAMQARLAMARMYMDVGRDEDAAEQLRRLLDSKMDPELALVGRLRLAKVLLYQGKPEEVLSLLQDYRDTSFAARYSETLGDAYVALGRIDDAAAAYSAALADNPDTPTVDRALVQMKIYDLPASPAGKALDADAPAGKAASGGAMPDSDAPPNGATPAGDAGETPQTGERE